ncbi:carbohydrate binding family 9 domain-containing protein [Flavobacteriaceae bacterium TK19130]|nr:carbohydrate binding family 9 domain-containing protein [Thermobacterium salinum]
MPRSSIALAISILFSFVGISQTETPSDSLKTPEKRVYTTTSIGQNEAPKIDGNLDDAAWSLVDWATDYVENQPDNGTPPTEQTKFKILYDDKNLYVAFRCYDAEPSKIEKRLSRRDGFAGDWVEINIDSYNDDRTGFSFTASVSGVKGDEFISNNGNNWDSSWNPIWYLKTQVDAEGWTAEIRIPLSQLRFGKAENQVWGLQSTRRYFRNEERSLWQPVLPNAPGWVSEFGKLRGLKGLKPQKQIEIQPYGLAQLDTYEGEEDNPFLDGSDTRFTAGLDAKIGVTNDLTLDVTINPDFGQVDADPGAIALDGFEIFFQERRPFFVENKNIFDYNFAGNQDNLFFSRRIGRTPQGSAVGSAIAFVDQPDNTTILGAAKFSGKTQDGWSIGVLESVTDKEYADVINEDGSEEEVLVEPLTNYVVGRVQKDFNNRNSFIGGIITGTHRDLEGKLNFLHQNAYSGGLDFKHNWKERKYYVEGSAVISQVNGSEEAITQTQQSIVHLFQRSDASHVSVDTTRTSLTGTGGRFEIGKGGGGDWRYNVGGNWRSPELELNDIGFLRQADDIRQYANVFRFFNKPTSWYRQGNIRFNQFSSYDFEGNYNRMQYEIGSWFNFKNNWWGEVGGAHKPRIYINSFLRGGPRWRYNEENYFFAFMGTDGRKKLSGTIGYVHSQAKQDNFGLRRYELRLNYQPLDALSMSLNTEFENSPNKTQYVSQQNFNGTTRYITGEIDQQTISTTLRVNYNINPDLTIQFYGQPFISRGRYSNFNYVTNATAEDLNERVQLYDENQISEQDGGFLIDENKDGTTDYSFGNPDFAFVQFRSNLVIRWEYIPGSEVFLVWSQGINGLGDADNDFNTIIDTQLLQQRPRNTFLIKATYRFVL